jgi:ATP-dependent DNA helicase RecG
MKENPYVTTKQLADTIGLSTRGIEEIIKKLKKQGRIRRIGGDNGGHWVVIEK